MSRPKTLLLVVAIPVAAVAYVAIMGSTGACPTCARIVAAVMPAASSSADSADMSTPSKAAEPDQFPANSIFNVPVKNLDGSTTTLAQFAGEPLFIEVWATWCAPCVKARKEINQHARKFNDVATVVGINADTGGPQVVDRYLKSNPSPAFEEFLGTPEFYDAIRPFERGKTIPKFVFVSPQGEVIDIVYGMPEVEFAIAMLRNLRSSTPGPNG